MKKGVADNSEKKNSSSNTRKLKKISLLKKNILIIITILIVFITMSVLFLTQKNSIEVANDTFIEANTSYRIETKDGIYIDIPKDLQINIMPPIFSNGYTYYVIVPKGEDITSENKISFYLFQENTDENYSLYTQYPGKLYLYGDGSIDMSEVNTGKLRNYRTLETTAKFKNGWMPQFTHYIFDVIPEKGVSVVSFGYTKNNNDPNKNLDAAWESIKNSLYIPDKFLQETYGDIHLPRNEINNQ